MENEKPKTSGEYQEALRDLALAARNDPGLLAPDAGALAAEIMARTFSAMPEEIGSPDQLHQLVSALIIFQDLADEDRDEQVNVGMALNYMLPNVMKAVLLMQFLRDCVDPDADRLSRDGKMAALEFSEILGPDWAQVFYRFAVLVTKLA